MALEKTFERPDGTSGNYWRIQDVELNGGKGTMNIRIVLYMSNAARQAGKTPMDVEKRFTRVPIQLTNLVTYIYTTVKTTLATDQETGDWPYFADAVDV